VFDFDLCLGKFVVEIIHGEPAAFPVRVVNQERENEGEDSADWKAKSKRA
jgi:hypothetical protein